MTHTSYLACFLAACWLACSPAYGVIGYLYQYGTAGDGTDFIPDISTTDLVNNGAPSLASVSSTPLTFIGNVNDGSGAGTPIREDAVWTGPTEYSATITFNLDTVANPLGYRISSLSTFSGSGVGLDPEWTGRYHEIAHQSYTVAYSLVGSASFVDFATVAAAADTDEFAAKVTLVNINTVVPDGVDALRFIWQDPIPAIASSTAPERSATTIREIDVIGSPVPEPNSTALLAVTALCTCLLRRRGRGN